MGRSSSQADKETIIRLSRPCPYPEWLLLELPDGRFAAFWSQGFEVDNATLVAKGDYKSACAFINKNKELVLAYMARNRLE